MPPSLNDGLINNLEYCIYIWFSGNIIAILKVQECAFSGKVFGYDQIEIDQEEGLLGVTHASW